MLALIVERQIKLKIRVFSKINCHSICTYGSQNLSVSISHIRGLGALKQLTKVYYSFNNDYHYELSVSKPYKKKKNKANCRTTKKTNYTEFSPYAKTKDNGGHNKNNNDNDIDNNDNNNNYHYCYYNNNNNNNNSTNDRKLIKQKPKSTTKNKFKETEKK